MGRVRKYLRGPAIGSISQLAVEVLDKRSYVFFHGRPMHVGWVQSMQLGYLNGLIRRGKLETAILNPDWTPTPEKGAF